MSIYNSLLASRQLTIEARKGYCKGTGQVMCANLLNYYLEVTW